METQNRILIVIHEGFPVIIELTVRAQNTMQSTVIWRRLGRPGESKATVTFLCQLKQGNFLTHFAYD